jgi:hypothetical protein
MSTRPSEQCIGFPSAAGQKREGEIESIQRAIGSRNGSRQVTDKGAGDAATRQLDCRLDGMCTTWQGRVLVGPNHVRAFLFSLLG